VADGEQQPIGEGQLCQEHLQRHTASALQPRQPTRIHRFGGVPEWFAHRNAGTEKCLDWANAKVHGIQQYMRDRDIRQPLLQFGRALVHFAVDTEEAYMCTKLEGTKSVFLPFNKGHNHGKGNPPNPYGHRSAYLWEEVFKPKSLANIIQHFVRFDGSASEALALRTLYFPRYHQMEVVRRILAHAAQNGVGQSYLIQHSAGSGKSNSITWAAYQLIEVYPMAESLPGARGLHTPLFDSVIVVTDRRLLDKQLRDNIKEFSEVKNIVAPAYSSKDLKENLEQGKKIIITTIQKFPFIVDGIADLSDKRFAVIIDEAHSSQGGLAAGKMNEAMGVISVSGRVRARRKWTDRTKSCKRCDHGR
jgi:type I restriction enzyme R subunit